MTSQKILNNLYINRKWHAKFQIFRLLNRDSDWLNFMHFSGYCKHKINLVSILRKREDQVLISISTILTFSALLSAHIYLNKSLLLNSLNLLLFLKLDQQLVFRLLLKINPITSQGSNFVLVLNSA